MPGPKHQEAAGKIAESYNTALSRSPDQPVFILVLTAVTLPTTFPCYINILTVQQDTPEFLTSVLATYRMPMERCVMRHLGEVGSQPYPPASEIQS